MSIKINKNDKEYELGFMPEHYPADRVYLDGDTSKTVQGAIDSLKYHTLDVPIAGIVISSNYATKNTGLDTTKYTVIGFYETSAWDDKLNYSVFNKGATLLIRCTQSSYTIPNDRGAIKLIYVDNDAFV